MPQQETNTQMMDDLAKVMGNTFFNHNGLLVEQLIGAVRWNKKTFRNTDKLDEYLKESDTILSNNSKNKKGQP